MRSCRSTLRPLMPRRVLVAGIGNVFLGDDAFGVEVVQRLDGRKLPEGVEVVDFGIRGMDLAYALYEDYDLVVFVDATMRGGEPGTVYLIEPEIEEGGAVSLDTHGMDPVKVIRLSGALGASLTRTLVVGCEPQVIPGRRGGSQIHPYDDMLMELSEPVRAAVEEAAKLVESLVVEVGTDEGSGKAAGSSIEREVES
jgi:hydrogenase maturation protease